MYALAHYLNHNDEETGRTPTKMEAVVGQPTRWLKYPHFNILYSNVNCFLFSTIRVPLQCTNCSLARFSTGMHPATNSFSLTIPSLTNNSRWTTHTITKPRLGEGSTSTAVTWQRLETTPAKRTRSS